MRVVGGGCDVVGLQYLAMEEVLRRIYKIRQRNVQRKRIDKALEGEQYLLVQRKKYDFRDDDFLQTPRTRLAFEDEIRFEKELNQTKSRHFALLPAIVPHKQYFKLPLVSKKEPVKLLRRKFRRAVWVVVFLLRAEQKVKETMLRRKRRAQKCYKHLLAFIERLVRGYYERELKEELKNYIQILEESLIHPQHDAQKETLQMMYYMSEKLSNSTVTKDILQFFLQAATNNSFPPADFLSAMEIARLQFSSKYGCLVQVSQQQTRMMVALGLGVKVFCFYVLYQPWKLGTATQTVINNAGALRETVYRIGSIFYYPLIEQFCLKLREVRSLSKSLLVTFGIRAIPQLDPCSQGRRQPNTLKQLIVGQNRAYLNGLQLRHQELCRRIRSNLTKWISRISYACLKQATRKDRNKEQSSYYRTVAESDEPSLRKPYRSLEIEQGRNQSVQKAAKPKAFPSLKRIK